MGQIGTGSYYRCGPAAVNYQLGGEKKQKNDVISQVRMKSFRMKVHKSICERENAKWKKSELATVR